MHYHHAIHITEETARRLAEHVGSSQEALETALVTTPEKAHDALSSSPPSQLAMSVDGVMISLRGPQWVEVRTMAIGTPKVKKKTQGKQEIHVDTLSYFSRLTTSSRFTELMRPEMQRRQIMSATAACAVTDGAEWCQAMANTYRPDAVRILDFPHAMEHIGDLLEAIAKAGVPVPAGTRDRCAHILKHRGPGPLWRLIDRMPEKLRQNKDIQAELDYLRPREPMMQYPEYQRQGWPIGDGMIESANNHVIQARLKGAGMHWKGENVNPMLALRTSLRNDRWEQMWEAVCASDRQEKITRRLVLVERRKETPAEEEATICPPTPSPDLPKDVHPSPHKHSFSRSRYKKKAPAGPSLHPMGKPREEHCLICGTALLHPTKGGGGNNKRYCSATCRWHAYKKRQLALR